MRPYRIGPVQPGPARLTYWSRRRGAGYPEAVVSLTIAQDPAADRVLSGDPFALLIGMLLDQQFPMERAFAGPAKVLERFGTLDPAAVAAADPETFADLCARRRRSTATAGRWPRGSRRWRPSSATLRRGRRVRSGGTPRPGPSSWPGSRRCRGSVSRRRGSSPPCSEAARGAPARLGGGLRCVRRAWVLPFGRRRRRRRVAAEGRDFKKAAKAATAGLTS